MRVIVTARARRDIFILLVTSRSQFGLEAQKRYRVLLEQAIADVADDPSRPGVTRPDGVPQGIWLYHVRHARTRTPANQRVGRPRHVFVFRQRGDALDLLRVLHDAMDLPSHMAGL
jgi:toxin ParE1/3/4